MQLREVLAGSSPLPARGCCCRWRLQLDRHPLGQTTYGLLTCVINVYCNLICPNVFTGVHKEIQFPKSGGERGEEYVVVMNKMDVNQSLWEVYLHRFGHAFWIAVLEHDLTPFIPQTHSLLVS